MDVSTVFTPRRSIVNLDMYIPRLNLEQAVLRSIKGSMHPLLFGESGNGKSWLYKKVLDQNKIEYAVANCANASRFKSLTEEIRSTLTPAGRATKTGYTENKEASVKALVAEGKLTHQNQFTVQRDEPLYDALRAFRHRAKDAKTLVLVLDNLESIFFNPDLMNELADIIILLDDSRYSVFNVKLLIVGIPNGALEYFAKTKNLESVANRIEELPKVGGMDFAQVSDLVKRGFKLLGFNLTPEDLEQVSRHVHHVTMGVPQRAHEYCEKLSHCIADNRAGYERSLLGEADKAWTSMGLRQAYTVMESHLNSKRTSIARRNQVLYVIGQIKAHQFDANTIATRIREIFPETASSSGMGISTILSELAAGKNALLTRNTNTKDYRVADPRYVMCLRVALFLDPRTKAVTRRMFSN